MNEETEIKGLREKTEDLQYAVKSVLLAFLELTHSFDYTNPSETKLKTAYMAAQGLCPIIQLQLEAAERQAERLVNDMLCQKIN